MRPPDTCPFLLEGDTLSLSSDFELEELVLHDTILRARHTLSPGGRPLLKKLQQDTTYAQLCTHAIHAGLTVADLRALLGVLNSLGALVITRSLPSRVRAGVVQFRHASTGAGLYPRLMWRRPARTEHILHGVVRATYPVLVGSAASTSLLGATGIFTQRHTVGLALFVPSLFLGSIFVHELGHVLVIHRSGMGAVIMQRGLRVGIVHGMMPRMTELGVTIAGPLLGLTTCLLASAVLALMGWTLYAGTALSMSAFHLTSFWPGYGDGASLYRIIRARNTRASA